MPEVIYSNASMVLNKHYPVAERHVFDEVVTGIYIIQNTESDKTYVGASKNVAVRWSSHRGTLRCASYEIGNDYLQNPDNFVFVLVERCTIDELRARELYWVNELQSMRSQWGYNCKRPTYCTDVPDSRRIRVPAA